MSDLRVWPGEPYPLGATWDGRGVNFALFSENAHRVELCLFDPRGRREIARLPLMEQTHDVWHSYLPDIRPGQLYGYRVFGPYRPRDGHRFNPHKLLLDPYAKAIEGRLRWTDAHYGYRVGSPEQDLSFDRRDNAAAMPKCKVIDTAFTWGADRRPETDWHRSIIYEIHVKGATWRHPLVPEPLRGTFAGLGAQAMVDYLRALGVTAVELLPIHAFIDDRPLVDRGLVNYWGYNPLLYFAIEPCYLASDEIAEFKTLVHIFHGAGIEVLLDVVYNHTGEGDRLGPTLCFRGIDNRSYYKLKPDDPRSYFDSTGTGNSLNLEHPRVLQMVLDSLRYWVEEMHVDGFRFDLASTLARDGPQGHFDPHGGFLDAIGQDPVLSRVKLIAEPWDLGEQGYRLGGFPPGWAEWNDRFRDVVRRFWRGDQGQVAELASRLTGSSDVFGRHGRRPWASVNFVTAHDGFTLQDLVSYKEKHNEANGEDNRDGSDANWSANYGIEGPTDDPAIASLRARQQRNMLATLLLSQGVPMILGGDEFGRTQGGNNNPYNQDNAVSWFDWSLLGQDQGSALWDFVRGLIRLRQDHIVLHRQRFFHGGITPGTEVKDITWLKPDGAEMNDADWASPTKYLSFLLSGEAGHYHLTLAGQPEPDDSFFVILNAEEKPVHFVFPAPSYALGWTQVVDTNVPDGFPKGAPYRPGAGHRAAARSLQLFSMEPRLARTSGDQE